MIQAGRRFKKRYILYAAFVAAAAFLAARLIPSGADFLPDAAGTASGYVRPGAVPAGSYAVPLDPASPWPKFRANELQNGRSPVLPRVDAAARPWTFPTGKGVFSSPVVDAEGTAYVGSADRWFYAIRRDGTLKWKFETGEIIDSSALLDDRGRVYFGSGDRHLYCLDRATGGLAWKFQAHSPEEVTRDFGVKTHNVAWFEGNVSMLADGSLLAPDDNCLVYRIDRDAGSRSGQFAGNEMVWSAPAVNVGTGRIFFGTTYLAAKTVFAYDARSGKRAWTAGGLGSTAASGLLTSRSPKGALVIGSFDGYVRAYSQGSGRRLWSFGARDHIYASPAQLSDGTIIQPAADGTVYALDPRTGREKWAFDTLEPIRSSPAVGGDDRIYVGSGEGRLFCIEPDGRLRWAYRCIEEDRNDLNASPALGADGAYVAGESGGVFFVPYDYPLSAAGASDPRCLRGPGEDLPGEGARLLYTTSFGAPKPEPPASIAANAPITLSLLVRRGGDTVLAAIDRGSLSASARVAPAGGGAASEPKFRLSVSADRRFLTLVPEEAWAGPGGGELRLSLEGRYLARLRRFGLKFFGGIRGGELRESFSFSIPPRSGSGSPYSAPNALGEPQTAFEFSRLAAPEPTMLPSWNQIGFDSLHYLAGLVAPLPGPGNSGSPNAPQARYVAWVVGGRKGEGGAAPDPSLETRYPLVLEYDRGLATFRNYEGFKTSFVGSWDMPFGRYRLAFAADPASGAPTSPASLVATALCDQIKFYGLGLKLMGISDQRTGEMTVAGGMMAALWGGSSPIPASAGLEAAFGSAPGSAWAEVKGGGLRAGEHVYGLLLCDAASGMPLPLYYTKRTRVESGASGAVTRVSVSFDKGEARGRARAYLMVDAYPVARGEVELAP